VGKIIKIIMKLYYSTTEGSVYYAVYDNDIFRFTHTTNIPLSTFDIDEVSPDNKALCLDLKRTEWKFDINGKRKYFVSAGVLNSRDNWAEYLPDLI
jgi:hypothetical protein